MIILIKNTIFQYIQCNQNILKKMMFIKRFEIEIEINLNFRSKDEGFRPITFMSDVDHLEFEDESIIDAFKRRAPSSGQKNM
jgi:hypothetical protein